MRSSLPTESDINVYDSLDERCAVEHFLGKDLAAAESLFRENCIRYTEDLMWMGPVAFCFYVPAVIRYLVSPAANHNCGGVSAFYETVMFRLESEPAVVMTIAPVLRDAVKEILSNFGRYRVPAEIYGDLEEKYRLLLVCLNR